MTHSMTAFARQSIATDWGNAHWEIRSVNQRYLETNFRMPENLRSLEFGLRDMLRKRLQRGKLDISLRIEYSSGSDNQLTLNTALAKQLLEAHAQLQELIEPQAPDLNQILRWPGVTQTAQLDTSNQEKQLSQAFNQAIDSLIAMRKTEGEALKNIIEKKLAILSEQVTIAREQMPLVIQWQQERIQARFAEAKVELEPERLAQEMVMLAQKIDVAEELDRLDTHIHEVDRLLSTGGTIGRRLDFLMQEMNREANTLGSKSIHSDITTASVNMKVCIEQMREQVQNIE